VKSPGAVSKSRGTSRRLKILLRTSNVSHLGDVALKKETSVVKHKTAEKYRSGRPKKVSSDKVKSVITLAMNWKP